MDELKNKVFQAEEQKINSALPKNYTTEEATASSEIDENDGECITLNDGTDISELDFRYRRMACNFSKKEVAQWYNTRLTLNRLSDMAERGEELPINQGDYLFTGDLDAYFGYVIQIREHIVGKVLFKYLDIVVGKTIKTIRYNPKDFRDPVTRAITDLYGMFFDEKKFFDNLIRIEVENITDSSDTITYSKIKKFVFVKHEAEEALEKCVYLLLERKRSQSAS